MFAQYLEGLRQIGWLVDGLMGVGSVLLGIGSLAEFFGIIGVCLEHKRFENKYWCYKILCYGLIISMCAYVIIFCVVIVNNERTIAIVEIVIIVGDLFLLHFSNKYARICFLQAFIEKGLDAAVPTQFGKRTICLKEKSGFLVIAFQDKNQRRLEKKNKYKITLEEIYSCLYEEEYTIYKEREGLIITKQESL